MVFNSVLRQRIRHPLLWLLIYGALVAFGLYSFRQMAVEVLPQFHYPQIRVVAHLPGATAEELETLITRPLEGAVLSLPNLVSVRSVMGTGTVEVDARFAQGMDVQQSLQSVQSALDRSRADLPPEVRPHAEIMGDAINEVADYVISVPTSSTPMAEQTAIETDVVPALRSLSGVQRVEVFGAGAESLWVQPISSALAQYGVSPTAIASAVKNQVVLGPGGTLSLGHQDVLIEARHLPLSAADLASIRVSTASGAVPLSELARIVHASIPTHGAVALDGLPSVAMTIFKQPGASTLPVTEAVKSTLARTLGQLPAGSGWVRTYNQGHLVGLIGSDLGRNLALGGLLAIAVLFWILGAGRGVWALALSIPLSLLLGIAGLYEAGQSLNLLTLGALSVAVGLLVDDAIIVLESIYYRWETGMTGWPGVWAGVRDIAGPDVTGTLTTVSVYVPLMFVGGLAGLFFVPFALSMGLSLLASLFVSLTFIPLFMGFLGRAPVARNGLGQRFLGALRRRNQQLLGLTLRHPKKSLGFCALMLVVSVGLLVIVPVSFLPLPNEGVLLESFTLPPGSSLADTRRVGLDLAQRLGRDPAVAHTFLRVGSPGSSSYTEGSYAGEIEIALKKNVDVHSLDAIGQRLLRLSQTTGVQLALGTPTLERIGESLSGLPQPFVLQLFGPDIARLRTLSEAITAKLKDVPLLADVFNNDGYPVTQLKIRPDDAALALHGLTPAGFYQQLNLLMNGQVLAEVPRQGHALSLYLRLRDVAGRDPNAVGQLPIRTDTGSIPLSQLANMELVTAPNQIRHINGARALEILAIPQGPLGMTISQAKDALASVNLPTNYRFEFGGMFPELEQAAIALGVAFVAAFVIMVSILVLQFDGMLVPGLLLLQMPLALTGGALALVISGVGLNATGLIAFLTLIGVSLNHGIVLLHRVRNNEHQGIPLQPAVEEAVQVRFRPILLTTLTAMLGMLPTALGWGVGAAPEQGLAVVTLGGIFWSAILSTNLLPALYLHRRQRQLDSATASEVTS